MAFLIEWDASEHTYEVNGKIVPIDCGQILNLSSDAEQFLLAMQPHQAWWFETLVNENFGCVVADNADYTSLTWKDAKLYGRIPQDALFNSYMRWHKENRPAQERQTPKGEVLKYIKETCESFNFGMRKEFKATDALYRVAQGKPTCFDMCSIEAARADFEKATRFQFDWEKGEPLDHNAPIADGKNTEGGISVIPASEGGMGFLDAFPDIKRIDENHDLKLPVDMDDFE